jgi:hypothetical protein
MVIQSNPIAPAHDPEKPAPVFRGDHAQTKQLWRDGDSI